MLKVVFVGHRDLYFGAEAVLFRVMTLLKNKSIAEPLVVLPTSDKNGFRGKCKMANITKITRVPFKFLNGSFFRCLLCLVYDLPALVYLYFFCRRQQVDVVYTNTSVNIIGPLLAFILNKRHIWHFHEQPTSGDFKWIAPGLFSLYRFLLNRKGTTVVFVSNTQKSLWEQEFGFKIVNSRVIYTPPEKISETAALEPGQGIAEEEVVTFGFLGSFTASKNLCSLLRVFAKLQVNYPKSKMRLLLMGEGELEGAILAQIKALGLQNGVTLLAHSTSILPFFSAVTIFVLPSLFESWGLTALEAIQQQKPLILTSNTALTEILTPGKDCLFINPQEEHSLYGAMEQLLLLPVERMNMANHAYHTLQRLHLDIKFEASVAALFD